MKRAKREEEKETKKEPTVSECRKHAHERTCMQRLAVHGEVVEVCMCAPM